MRAIRKPAYKDEVDDYTSSSDDDVAPKPYGGRKKGGHNSSSSSVSTHTIKAGATSVVASTNEYINKRQRNNLAVRKSRNKLRSMKDEAMVQLNSMSQEKDELESMMGNLSDEIKMLKEVLIGITGGSLTSSALSSNASTPNNEPDTIDLSQLKYFDLSKFGQ